MRGRVYQQSGVWAFVVDIDRDPVGGRRRQQRRSGFRTKREAQRALTEVLGEVQSGGHVASGAQTLSEWIAEWLPVMAMKVRPTTIRDYENSLAHVTQHLGGVKLRDLRSIAIERTYAALLVEGRRYGGGLSPKSVRNAHTALRRCLADAERHGLVARNPAALVTPPRADRPEMKTWTADELGAFLDHIAADRLVAAFRLLALTGARRGEILGLRWTDIDFDGERLTISRSLTTHSGKPVFSETKTAKSRRTVGLDPDTVTQLRSHRVRQHEERLRAGSAWTDNGLVYCQEDGSPLHPDSVTRLFERRVRDAGLPRIRLHDLRHGWASMALLAGIHPKVVSERLGHATVGVTLDIYSHVAAGLDSDAAIQVAALVPQKSQ